MASDPKNNINTIFPACRRLLENETWERLVVECQGPDFSSLPDLLLKPEYQDQTPAYLPDLARLELKLYQSEHKSAPPPETVEEITVNPSLQLMEMPWQGLLSVAWPDDHKNTPPPAPGLEIILIWRKPSSTTVLAKTATEEDLAVLKILMENISRQDAAEAGNLPIGAIDQAIERAADRYLLLAPESTIRRDPALFPADFPADPNEFNHPEVFTLQWHITQECDLHCKHCYDRSDRTTLSFEQALTVLNDFRNFCLKRNVHGQITFTGGNPLLYPNFTELYQAATDHGFTLAILGNPAPKEKIEELIAIQMPSFYQISLEGLPEHNDAIRGKGHFKRSLAFLDVLKELDLFAMVMLTLTRENIEQVLPLAERLRGLTDSFTFNRLAMVGEGAALLSAEPSRFKTFLEEYLKAVPDNPIMRIKDNLFNILNMQQNEELFGGCAGYGCGAAFSFISLLPDGEVHACRKFPSPIGNILSHNLGEIFESESANKYRAGTTACKDCTIRPACGGCLAVAHGFGLDIFSEKDPYCFLT